MSTKAFMTRVGSSMYSGLRKNEPDREDRISNNWGREGGNFHCVIGRLHGVSYRSAQPISKPNHSSKIVGVVVSPPESRSYLIATNLYNYVLNG